MLRKAYYHYTNDDPRRERRFNSPVPVAAQKTPGPEPTGAQVKLFRHTFNLNHAE